MSTVKRNDAGFTAEQRRQVLAEVNSRKVNIDRNVFKKSDKEKSEVKQMKKAYKEIERASQLN